MERIPVYVGAGELIDRLTILQLKSDRLPSGDARDRVRERLRELQPFRAALTASRDLEHLETRLFAVNSDLWDCEETIRRCDKAEDFGPEFVAMACEITRKNDERARLKAEIDQLIMGHVEEAKSHLSLPEPRS